MDKFKALRIVRTFGTQNANQVGDYLTQSDVLIESNTNGWILMQTRRTMNRNKLLIQVPTQITNEQLSFHIPMLSGLCHSKRGNMLD